MAGVGRPGLSGGRTSLRDTPAPTI